MKLQYATILLALSILAHADLKKVKEPTEVVEVPLSTQSYSTIKARFQSLAPIQDPQDWKKAAGTWLQFEMLPDPAFFTDQKMVANSEEIVVKTKPDLEVYDHFYPMDRKNYGKLSTEMIETRDKWYCFKEETDCGWVNVTISGTPSYYRACRLDLPHDEILCRGVLSKGTSSNLGETFIVFKRRKPGMKLRHLKISQQAR